MIEFKRLGNTFWWDCPGCGRKVHTTRKNRPGSTHTGIDFRCSQGCKLRHCVEWARESTDAKIYSYDRCTCDMRQLPLLARLEV